MRNCDPLPPPPIDVFNSIRLLVPAQAAAGTICISKRAPLFRGRERRTLVSSFPGMLLLPLLPLKSHGIQRCRASLRLRSLRPSRSHRCAETYHFHQRFHHCPTIVFRYHCVSVRLYKSDSFSAKYQFLRRMNCNSHGRVV